MTPLTHARNSARRFGGAPEDYLDIHVWFDQTKLHVPDLRHRNVLHNGFGIGLCEERFGLARTNSGGKTYAVRQVAEQHVIEDIGFIPSLAQCLEAMPVTDLVAPRLRKLVVVGPKAAETE